jgi:hypothetical protein
MGRISENEQIIVNFNLKILFLTLYEIFFKLILKTLH